RRRSRPTRSAASSFALHHPTPYVLLVPNFRRTPSMSAQKFCLYSSSRHAPRFTLVRAMLFLVCVGPISLASLAQDVPATPAYKNIHDTPEDRITDLLSR